MTYQHSNIRIFYVFALILLLFIGCEDQQQPFPYVRFDVTFDVGTELNNIVEGEFVFINADDCGESKNCGYGGLIIYRSSRNNFQAFDRACPYKPEEKCILEVDEEFGDVNILSCPCCGSKFKLFDDGKVLVGPATTTSRGLKQYQTNYLKKSEQVKVWNY